MKDIEPSVLGLKQIRNLCGPVCSTGISSTDESGDFNFAVSFPINSKFNN
jgi:hypothetical protein